MIKGIATDQQVDRRMMGLDGFDESLRTEVGISDLFAVSRRRAVA
ncbi:hypothetical protein [Rhizobium sullae]|nr:hypothetical protein [Rhizobium sullae]